MCPAAGDDVRGDDDGAVPLLDRHQPAFEPVEAELGPPVRHAADPVVVGRRAPQREPGRCGQRRVHQQAVVIDEALASTRRRRRVAVVTGSLSARVSSSRCSARSGTCCSATRRPRGASAVGTRVHPQRQPRLGVLVGLVGVPGEQLGRDLEPRAPARGQVGQLARDGRREPGPVRAVGQQRTTSARSHDRSRTSWRFSSTTARGSPAGSSPGRIRTGDARARCSCIAGFGVRSGKTMPSATKLPSFGSSPKSPPYAQRKPCGGRPVALTSGAARLPRRQPRPAVHRGGAAGSRGPRTPR